jgi:hypothetical protein
VIRNPERDAIAAPQPKVEQAGSERVDGSVELGEADTPPAGEWLSKTWLCARGFLLDDT